MMSTVLGFRKAVPIWIQDEETTMNLRVQFKAIVASSDNCDVKIATSGMYQLWVNGKFLAYGPARAGKGQFRMDCVSLSEHLTEEENCVVIEVVGYNTNSYAIQNQSSFLQAEVIEGDNVVVATGIDFTARINPYYYRKVPRYSFQRPMMEGYRFDEVADDFYVNPKKLGTEVIQVAEAKKIIARNVAYPEYERIGATAISYGIVQEREPEEYLKDRSTEDISDTLLGFPAEELDIFPTEECQRLQFVPVKEQNIQASETVELQSRQYVIYKLPHNASGFVRFQIECKEKMTLYIAFDELLCQGKVDFLRMQCSNVVRYDLCQGTHELQFFEVYTMQYLQFIAIGGGCILKDVQMIEYKHPPVQRVLYKDDALQKISDAAIETFRQNAVDIFMDCPSRERAGWLCDSFFLGRTEKCLTGENRVEKNFLENFLHEENYEYLPEGIFPMCYPADHYNGNFIVSWNMWLVLELKDYLHRTGDRELIERFQHKIERFFQYISTFENEDGLLEKLPAWVFVEWSKANDLVQDVNYPNNMMYYVALQAAADLYGNQDYRIKAERLKESIIAQSFDGQFFTDHAERKEDGLYNDGTKTEVCQYYAFFTGIADRNTHEELFQYMLKNFGPQRHTVKDGIYPAAPFVGNYLRLEIMLQEGFWQEVLDNIKGYFLYMAERTGTLWEYATENASCNHGFASYVLYWLSKMKF